MEAHMEPDYTVLPFQSYCYELGATTNGNEEGF